VLLIGLYLLWLAFNGRLTLEIALIGIPVTGMVYLISLKTLNITAKRDLGRLARFPRFAGYFLFLLKETLKCALHVGSLIWRGEQPDSCLYIFESGLKKKLSGVILADSITLTPGTITVEDEDGKFTIHCLEASSGPETENGEMLRRIRKLEEG